jgi:hypothetical protein
MNGHWWSATAWTDLTSIKSLRRPVQKSNLATVSRFSSLINLEGRVSSLQEYNTGVYLDQQLVAQYIIPLMAPEARFLGLQLFIPVHLKYFGQSQHAAHAGLLSPPLILHQVRILCPQGKGMLFGMSFPQHAPNKHESSGVPYCFKSHLQPPKV